MIPPPAVWALIVLKHRPLVRSQDRIAASSPALMSTLLSGVTARAHPSGVAFHGPLFRHVGMSNNLMVWPYSIEAGLAIILAR